MQQQLANKIKDFLLSYNPKKIGIFGSYARNENKPGSDIDILIDFNNNISLLKLISMEQKLSKELGIKVDLVTYNSISNPKMKKNINKDLQLIYG